MLQGADLRQQEISRATFLEADLTRKNGKELKAKLLRKRACAMLREFADLGDKTDDQIIMDDFDACITFWSR